MKLLVTSDLHYNVARSRAGVLRLAEEVCATPADALLVLGDVAGQDLGILREALGLFDGFAGRKLFVCGNHELWAPPGGSSLERLEAQVPAICREAGFHPLDLEPVVIGEVGLVGSVAWYDYSYRPERLGIPLRFYQAKTAPGAAGRIEAHMHLLADSSDVPAESLAMGARWMDGQHVHLPMSDEQFCEQLLARLAAHLAAIEPRCRTIVAGLHHVPFAEMVPQASDPSWAFAQAFLGSPRFGAVLLACPKVAVMLCGHAHQADRRRIGHIQCINVGCTYVEKRVEAIRIENGELRMENGDPAS